VEGLRILYKIAFSVIFDYIRRGANDEKITKVQNRGRRNKILGNTLNC
jgi:hypothetical protein